MTPNEVRETQRHHIAAVAEWMAEEAFRRASAPPDDALEGFRPEALDLEFLANEIAPLIVEAHGLGKRLLAEAECRQIAGRAFLDRLAEMYSGGAASADE